MNAPTISTVARAAALGLLTSLLSGCLFDQSSSSGSTAATASVTGAASGATTAPSPVLNPSPPPSTPVVSTPVVVTPAPTPKVLAPVTNPTPTPSTPVVSAPVVVTPTPAPKVLAPVTNPTPTPTPPAPTPVSSPAPSPSAPPVSQPAAASANVLMGRNDAAATGATLNETVLNASNVNVNQFGKLFSYAVDGQIYAQPLYVANVAVPGKGTHNNLVLVATMHDAVYAFDGDSNTGSDGGVVWQVNLANGGAVPIPISDLVNPSYGDIIGSVGIMGTPVIDAATQTLYLVARTKINNQYLQQLHALDIATGAEKFGAPVVIQASDSHGVAFDPKIHNQRAGLALVNGKIIIGWASHQDFYSYHGWVLAYDAATLKLAGAFCSTPTGSMAGIWQSGRPPAVDSKGAVYYFTANGSFDGSTNFGETALKLDSNAALALADWFTPSNYQALNNNDADLSSSGPLLLPGTHLLVGGGKEGILYLVDTTKMGKLQSGNPQVQAFKAANADIMGGPVYWNRSASAGGPLLFNWGVDDVLKAFSFDGQRLGTTPVSQSSASVSGHPGGILSLSANQSLPGTGIVWAAASNAGDVNHETKAGILRAYDAADLKHELWNSQLKPTRDDAGSFAKFNPPTVANGHVYLPTFSNQLAVYGLL